MLEAMTISSSKKKTEKPPACISPSRVSPLHCGSKTARNFPSCGLDLANHIFFFYRNGYAGGADRRRYLSAGIEDRRCDRPNSQVKLTVSCRISLLLNG